MDVISRLAHRLGWIPQGAHREIIAEWRARVQNLEDRIEGHRVAEISLSTAKDQLERQIEYLADELRKSNGELSEIRKGLMIRVGLLPAPRQESSDKDHKPIELRRKPWDEARAEVERLSKERHEHWLGRIKEVEERDRAREQQVTPQAQVDNVEANDIAELERE